MAMNVAIESPESYFSAAVGAAARFPGVRIHREAYLRRSLGRHCTEDQIARAVLESPAAAGISLAVLNRVAEESVAYESAKVTALSAVAGIPGGFAMVATIPGDVAQTLAHMLRIAQKLAYLYSWPDLFSEGGDEPDDATQGVLTLFVGVMVGTSAATEGVNALSKLVANRVATELPKAALTKGAIYPIVKTVARHLGVNMTKGLFAKGVAKIIPIIGAVASGALTLATYYPMAKRLKKHLSGLDLATPPAGTTTT